MNFFYDNNKVRYRLIKTSGGKNLNWLFMPGGAGGDSSYFESLTNGLCLEGNVWFVDLPGTGTNIVEKDDFERWFDIFVPTLARFENPVLVGHSFSGMMPFLFPELEHVLKGFVAIGASPCLWQEASARYAAEHNLPDLSEDMGNFLANPSQEKFNKAFFACAPYYFRPDFLEKGRELSKTITVRFEAAAWSAQKLAALNFNASWIPQKVETLLMGGKYDGIVPFSLFEEDKRFEGKHIQKALIDAGHMPWLENFSAVKECFDQFQEKL